MRVSARAGVRGASVLSTHALVRVLSHVHPRLPLAFAHSHAPRLPPLARSPCSYLGHSKGVQSIQFMPGTGHLLISGGLDGKIKVRAQQGGAASGLARRTLACARPALPSRRTPHPPSHPPSTQVWDVMTSRAVKRTYLGHTGAVREVKWTSDGARFASCSYDKHVKVRGWRGGACGLDRSSGRAHTRVRSLAHAAAAVGHRDGEVHVQLHDGPRALHRGVVPQG